MRCNTRVCEGSCSSAPYDAPRCDFVSLVSEIVLLWPIVALRDGRLSEKAAAELEGLAGHKMNVLNLG